MVECIERQRASVTKIGSTKSWHWTSSSLLSSDDLVEKNQKEVTIHDLDPLALTLLVDFSYTGEIIISEDNVQVSNIQGGLLLLDERILYTQVSLTTKNCSDLDIYYVCIIYYRVTWIV